MKIFSLSLSLYCCARGKEFDVLWCKQKRDWKSDCEAVQPRLKKGSYFSLKNYLFLMRDFVHPTLLCPNCTDTWDCFNCFYQDLEVFPTKENIFNFMSKFPRLIASQAYRTSNKVSSLKDGREMKEVVSITGRIILKFINKKSP